MPISHVSLSCGKDHYQKMRDFYAGILAPLGYKVFKEQAGCFAGFAPLHGAPDFWLHADEGSLSLFSGDVDKRQGRTHVAFGASSEKQVREWFQLALKAGGVSNGEPGERPDYVKRYYAAYVIDPLGNNIELVHWNPWWLQAIKASPIMLAGLLGVGLTVGYSRYS